MQSSTTPPLAAVFKNPGRYAPQRLPAFANVEQSAVLSLSQQFTTNLATADTTIIGNRMMLFRQPSMPVWTDQSHSAGWLLGARTPLSAPTILGSAPYTQTQTGSSFVDLGASGDSSLVPITTTAGGSTEYSVRVLGTSALTHPLLGAGLDDPRTFVGLPPTAGQTGSVLSVLIVLSSPDGNLSSYDVGVVGGNVSIKLEQVSAPGRYTPLEVLLTLQSPTFISVGAKSVWAVGYVSAVLWPGFYRVASFSITGTVPISDSLPEFADVWIGSLGGSLAHNVPAITGTTLAFTPTPRVQCVPAFAPIESATSFAHYVGSRCTALSLSMANVTAVLNKEGVIQAARLPYTVTNLGFTKATMNSVPPVKRFQCPMEAGAFFFAPPVSDLDSWLDFYCPLANGQVISTRPIFNLNSSAEFIAVSLNDATLTTVTTLACRLNMHLEFRSYSQLWPAGLSTRKLEELHGAVVAVLGSGFAKSGPGPEMSPSQVPQVKSQAESGKGSKAPKPAKQQKKPKETKPKKTPKPKAAAEPHKSN